MRTKVTLVLLLLTVALYFFIFMFERHWQADQRFDEARRRVLGPEVAVLGRLEIVREGAPTIRLERRGERWFLASPHDWPANPNAVARIVSELQFLEGETNFLVSELASAGQSLADYGLEQPALVVRYAPPEGPWAELRLGAVTQVGNRLYVLSPDGTRVHVVGRSLADSLALGLDQLRAGTLFSIPVFEARSIALQFPAPTNLRVRLSRSGTRWLFETPIQTRADKAAVELLINRLNALQVKSFFDARTPDPALTGLGDAALRITVEGNQRRETLLLGHRVGPPPGPDEFLSDYYARLEDRGAIVVATVPNDLFALLRNSQTELRDRRVLDFDPARLTALEVREPDRPEVILQRLETGQWQVLSRGDQRPPAPADPQFVAAALEALQHLAAQSFVSDAPSAADLEGFGFNRPEREVVLTLAGDGEGPAATAARTLALQLGRDPPAAGSRIFARVGGASFVYAVHPAILQRVPGTALAWRDRTVRTLPPGARLTGVVVRQLADDSTLFTRHLAPPGQTWEDALSGDPAPVREAVLQLVTELRELRATRFVRESFANSVEIDGEPRPWRYRLETEIRLAGGSGEPTTSSLFFSERLGGALQLVGSAEFDTVFEATQPMIDALFTLTEGRSDPGPPAPRTTSPPPPASESIPAPAADFEPPGTAPPKSPEPASTPDSAPPAPPPAPQDP
jgi:hypothetical protein